ncbi:unnamed protein product, partial [Rotaria sp. Silwood2]
CHECHALLDENPSSDQYCIRLGFINVPNIDQVL